MAGSSLDLSPGDRPFQGLLWTQALGAFNDNAFKSFIALMAVATLPAAEASRLIAVAGALFVAPFILFSTLAGTLADRYPKKRLVVALKAAELALMAAAFAALWLKSVPLLLGLLFLMGAHSAFFGPVKLAIVPELLEERHLSRGNGLMQMMTFLGIILGTVASGLLVEPLKDRWHLASALFVSAAAAGLLTSLLIAEVPARQPDATFRLNVAAQARENLRALNRFQPLFLATAGAAYFWFVGAMFQMNILVYGKELMKVSEGLLSAFQIVVAVGIGAGSLAAGKLSRDRVELGLVPLGALGLVLFSADLAFAFRSTARTVADLFLLGASAGCFVLPLQAFVQQRSPESRRGSFIATGNLLSFTAVLLASGWLWLFSETFHLHPGQVFLAVSLMTLVVAGYIVATLPDAFVRLLLYPVANLVYRIQVEGAERVPADGPALLVANHVSYVDPVFISAALERHVRYVMYRPYFEGPFRWFFRAMKAIPIASADNPKELLRSLQAAREALQRGELVCIFAEGQITRHGQTLPFKKGFERIVRGTRAPIVPVHLDRVWGSVFSFEGGKAVLKLPRRLPYPVTVSFGAPLPSTAAPHEVRQAILGLGAEAFRHRLSDWPPLPVAFFREARRHPLRFAMADSTGARLSYGSALARAWLLGRAIGRSAPDGENVGVFLPPSVPAALANLGLSLHGRVPINLNYTASPEVVEACVRKAGIRTVVTSRRFLEKLGWSARGDELFLEDVATAIGKVEAAAAAAALLLLPRFLPERIMLGKAPAGLDGLATVIFTSGSTGVPKGVLLSHSNILSNIEGLEQLFQLGPRDRILGALPFFHSFGFTATLWYPFVAGFGAVYHFNPLDAKTVGKLALEHGATLLLATPTFLAAYLRRVEPEAFKTLRYVVVGAEKLRPELARDFEKRFGILPLEGYGATELSPVTAVNIPDLPVSDGVQRGAKPGSVGHALPGVVPSVVDPESGAPLPPGMPGLLLIKGPNVMQGYLGEPERTREVLRDGAYVTGDIATLDEDGFLTITDRLSRFSKIGGEMVPHLKVEERLHELAGTTEPAFAVTAVPDDKRGERLVVLAAGPHDLDGLARKLQDSGLPKLWLPAREDFVPVEALPLLGSGKLDLQRVRSIAKERRPP